MRPVTRRLATAAASTAAAVATSSACVTASRNATASAASMDGVPMPPEPPIMPPETCIIPTICCSKNLGAVNPTASHSVVTPTTMTDAKAANSFQPSPAHHGRRPRSGASSDIGSLGGGWCHESVANATHGLDDRGVRRLVAQLVAEVGDVDVDDVLVVVLRAPDPLQQLRASKDPARLAGQCRQ